MGTDDFKSAIESTGLSLTQARVRRTGAQFPIPARLRMAFSQESVEKLEIAMFSQSRFYWMAVQWNLQDRDT